MYFNFMDQELHFIASTILLNLLSPYINLNETGFNNHCSSFWNHLPDHHRRTKATNQHSRHSFHSNKVNIGLTLMVQG